MDQQLIEKVMKQVSDVSLRPVFLASGKRSARQRRQRKNAAVILD